MKKWFIVPEDVAMINPDTDTPFTKANEWRDRVAMGEKLEPLSDEESKKPYTQSFAHYVRQITNYALRQTQDYLGVTELRIKWTAAPKTLVEYDDADPATMALLKIIERPKDAFPEQGALVCMLSYLPYTKAVLGASIEKPESVTIQ